VTDSANLDLVRSIYADAERGDFGSTDWADPNIEFIVADGPEPVSLRGVTAMVSWLNDFLNTWEGFRFRADAYRELDNDRVLALVRSTRGRAKASGLELGQHGGAGLALYNIRSARATRVVIYFNRERGLADLGLEE
jgi:hypothetical protein